MTETCLPIVTWLKNWFYDKTDIDTLNPWTTHRDDSSYKIYYNNDYVKVIFSLSTSGNYTTSWTEFGATPFDDSKVVPPNPVYFFVAGNVIAQIRTNSDKLRVRCVSGTYSGTLYGTVIYPRS